MYKYRTNFKLKYRLTPDNFVIAKPTLADMTDGFTQTIASDYQIELVSIQWRLLKLDGGVVEIISDTQLSDKQRNELTQFIKNQNTNELNDAFSHLEITTPGKNHYNIETKRLGLNSFDWQENNYPIRFVEEIK